jgi:hypothetical protein
VEENVMAVLTDGERRRQGDGYEPATERSCGECWSRLRLSSFYRARTTRRRGIAGGREMVVGGFNVPFWFRMRNEGAVVVRVYFRGGEGEAVVDFFAWEGGERHGSISQS